MKIKIAIGIVFLWVIFDFIRLGYSADCIDVNDKPVQTFTALFADYKNPEYSTQTGNTFEICFTDVKIGNSEKIIINNTDSLSHLVIKDFSITNKSTFDQSSTIELTGSNITLQNLTLTGNGNGIGVLVTGSNHSVISSTVQNFTTGIQIGDGDIPATSLEINDPNMNIKFVDTGINLAKAISPILGEISFTLNANGKHIFPTHVFEYGTVGKKCVTTNDELIDGKVVKVCNDVVDSNLVKEIDGKAPADLDSCNGTVEIYKYDLNLYQEQLVATCNFEGTPEKPRAASVNIVTPDKVVHPIPADTCAFVCPIIQDKTVIVGDLIYVKIEGLYSLLKINSEGVENVRVSVSSLLDAFSVMGPISNQDVGSEMGSDEDPVIPVEDPVIPVEDPVVPVGDPVVPTSPGEDPEDGDVPQVPIGTEPPPKGPVDTGNINEQDTEDQTESEFVSFDPNAPKDKDGKQMTNKIPTDNISNGAGVGCSGKASLLPDSRFSLAQFLVYSIMLFGVPSFVFIRVRRK